MFTPSLTGNRILGNLCDFLRLGALTYDVVWLWHLFHRVVSLCACSTISMVPSIVLMHYFYKASFDQTISPIDIPTPLGTWPLSSFYISSYFRFRGQRRGILSQSEVTNSLGASDKEEIMISSEGYDFYLHWVVKVTTIIKFNWAAASRAFLPICQSRLYIS